MKHLNFTLLTHSQISVFCCQMGMHLIECLSVGKELNLHVVEWPKFLFDSHCSFSEETFQKGGRWLDCIISYSCSCIYRTCSEGQNTCRISLLAGIVYGVLQQDSDFLYSQPYDMTSLLHILWMDRLCIRIDSANFSFSTWCMCMSWI